MAFIRICQSACTTAICRIGDRKVNTHLSRKGVLWEQESYDRIIRDEEHLFRVIQYIGRNPAKAGYPHEQWIRWIHPEWDEMGWGFKDE